MSVLRDIERAIGEGVKYLCTDRYWPGGIGNIDALISEAAQADKEKRPVRLQPICQTTDQARRILRVEMDHYVMDAVITDPDCPWRYDPFDMEGARRLRGVDVYAVYKLPSPGWRIINPMEAK